MNICAHSERYKKNTAGIFETQNIFWQHRVSIVIDLITRTNRWSFPGGADLMGFHKSRKDC